MPLTAEEIIRVLELVPLPIEGGFFRETYRSGLAIPGAALPPAYGGARDASTAIYYLLTPDVVSTLHRLPGDEIFHFYLGDPVKMLQLRPDGTGETIVIGADIGGGMRPQVVVRAGVWQGAMLAEGGRFALMGTTMAPGFDYRDYERADPLALTERYPACASAIALLAESGGD